MKKLLFQLILCIATPLSALNANSSYLLIQGDFDPNNPALETHLWEVVYQSGQPGTGQDLLNAVFGVPIDTGMQKADAFGTLRPVFSAGNTTLGATYMYYASFDSLLLDSVTIGGLTEGQNPTQTEGWNYYVAGGSGSSIPPGFTPGNYPSGTWTFAGDGAKTRNLSDLSFDGWVFGESFPATATIAGGDSTYAPLADRFANATLIVVPEPSGTLLFLLCLGALNLRRRR